MSLRYSHLFLACLVLVAASYQAVAEQKQFEGPVAVEAARSEVAALVAQLDGERFGVREHAAARLTELVSDDDSGGVYRQELRRVWLSTETSFEVRSRITPLVEPPGPEESLHTATESLNGVGAFSHQEIARLADQLNSDDYGRRQGATERLRWFARRAAWAGPIMLELKERLAAAELSDDARRRLESIWREARGTWLVSDASTWELPPVSVAEIAGWADDLARPRPASVRGNRPWHVHETARRELLDCLVQDQYVDPVAEVLRERIESGRLAEDAIARLEQVLDWTRPAMVAEYWQTDAPGPARHLGIQHLYVGVPSVPEGAQQASHFDRIDDEVAHCVSGNSLSPGEWPVGVAFPHPQQEEAFFHLVNLPTPRRRMAYEHDVERGERERLAEISQRTCDRFLAEKRSLTEREVFLLALLDPECVSRFAGSYLHLVDDQPFSETARGFGPFGRVSRHGALCVVLAMTGTREAGPALIEAAENRRILPPDSQAPYQFPWIAALAISRRDPWPGAERWLAAMLERGDALRVDEVEAPPELGATAAAALLAHRGAGSLAGTIEPVSDELLSELGCPPYRFTSSESRARLLQWWSSLDRSAKEPTSDGQSETARR